jgi:hypothetical protein
MQEKQLNELSDEELLKKWKDTKTPYLFVMATMIVSVIFTFIRMFISDFEFSMLAVPVFVGIIAFTITNNYKAVEAEMKARNFDLKK